MANHKEKITRHKAIFLDPKHIGSSVRYVVSAKYNPKNNCTDFNAELVMSDCDKHIAWMGYGPNGPEHMKKKLRKAIRFLEQCLRAVEEVETEYKKYRTKRRKKK